MKRSVTMALAGLALVAGLSTTAMAQGGGGGGGGRGGMGQMDPARMMELYFKGIELTADQQTNYDTFLAEVRAWETLPASSVKGAEVTPLDDNERMWLTRECLLRYLRATKWNTTQASTRLRCIWRVAAAAPDLRTKTGL